MLNEEEEDDKNEILMKVARDEKGDYK